MLSDLGKLEDEEKEPGEGIFVNFDQPTVEHFQLNEFTLHIGIKYTKRSRKMKEHILRQQE